MWLFRECSVGAVSGALQLTVACSSRARQSGDHSDHRSRKVLIFDGKFYLNFTRFCLHFDGKRVFVTETNILLLTI